MPRKPLLWKALAALVAVATVARWGMAALVWQHGLRIDKNGRVGQVFDDAYMFARYAKNLLDGHGIAWNPGGEQIYGNTSVLYLLAVVPLRAGLPYDDGQVVVLASAGFMLTGALATAWACREAAKQAGWDAPLVGWLAVVLPLLLFQPALRYHAITGMDTSLALTANALLVVAVMRALGDPLARSRESRPAGGVDAADAPGGGPPPVRGSVGRLAWIVPAAWLAVEARPDDGLYALLLPAGALLWAGRGRIAPERALAVIGGIVAACGLGVAIKWALFGDPLPLAFYVKSSGFYEGYAAGFKWNPVEYLLAFAWLALPFLIAVPAGLQRAQIAVVASLLVPVALTFGYFFDVTQIMGYQARYYVPALPLVAAAGAAAVGGAVSRAGSPVAAVRALAGPAGLVRAVIVAVVIALPFALADLPAAYAKSSLTKVKTDYRPFYTVEATKPLPRIKINQSATDVVAMARALPAGAVLAATEHGFVGSQLADKAILDLSGLHDRRIAHDGFSVAVLLERQPELVWLPHPDYVGMMERLYCAPAFWEAYDLYPEAFRFGVAVRKEGPHREAVEAVLRDRFARSYPGERLEERRARPRLEACREG